MIYFDNAATTYPKPRCVISEARRAIVEFAGNPGRGGHVLASRSAEAVYYARERISALMGCSPERVIFTVNATEALNMAISGLAQDGCEILISDIEHNSVRRAALSMRRRGCTVSVYKTGRSKEETVRSLEQKVTDRTRMVVACHRSNVFGRELPINEIAKFCKRRSIPFIVDASQSAGSCPIDFDSLGASALCAPGHKGMFGIMGGGFMLISKEIAPSSVEPLLQGGSGVDSLSVTMPQVFPERLEAGTLAVPAIYSMGAGADFIGKTGVKEIEKRERLITDLALERILSFGNRLQVYNPDENKGSILLFNIVGRGSEDTAAALSKAGICVRAGFHCSPLAHESIGTPSHGAVRASFGFFNRKSEIDVFYKTLKEML